MEARGLVYGHLGLNFVTAAACTILGFVYFAVAFAAGEAGEPVSAGVLVFLLATVISVPALGCWGGWRWSSFPWLAAILTPLFLAAVFSLFGDRDSGLRIGGFASLAFLVGALAGRGLKYRIRVRNRVGRTHFYGNGVFHLLTRVQCSLIGTWSITQSSCSAVSRV